MPPLSSTLNKRNSHQYPKYPSLVNKPKGTRTPSVFYCSFAFLILPLAQLTPLAAFCAAQALKYLRLPDPFQKKKAKILHPVK